MLSLSRLEKQEVRSEPENKKAGDIDKDRLRRESPRDAVTVYIPEYVVGHWWEQILHNQSALRLKGRLLFTPGVMVTSVPFHLASSTKAEQRLEREAAQENARRYLRSGQ